MIKFFKENTEMDMLAGVLIRPFQLSNYKTHGGKNCDEAEITHIDLLLLMRINLSVTM